MRILRENKLERILDEKNNILIVVYFFTGTNSDSSTAVGIGYGAYKLLF